MLLFGLWLRRRRFGLLLVCGENSGFTFFCPDGTTSFLHLLTLGVGVVGEVDDLGVQRDAVLAAHKVSVLRRVGSRFTLGFE